MSNLAEHVRALAAQAPFPAWLADARARALQQLAGSEFPGRKSESWKYSKLTALADSGALERSAAASYDALPATLAPVLAGWRLVIVNGRLDAAQSRLPDDGSLVVSALAGLPAAEQVIARELLALGNHEQLPFAVFNEAACSDGLYIRVPAGHVPAQPLHIIFHSTAAVAATVQTRLLVRVEERAQLTLVEQYTGTGAAVYSNANTVIDAGRGAQLDWLRLQFGDPHQFSTGRVHLRQQQDSECRSWLLMTGSRLTRNDITCELAAAGARLDLKGVFLAGAGEHIDNQVSIEHAAPHATSTQLFKGLAGGDGRAVLRGRIHIHPGAKQTSAELVNNNLLLSKDAEIDTKPELEIYNDDVKCAHGATIGQLNETAVFYLQSRGVAKADAELMLALGFVNALVDSVPLPELAAWLRGAGADWFARRGQRS